MRLKNTILCILVLSILLLTCSCQHENTHMKESVYNEKRVISEAVVVKYNKDHWYGGYQHHYRMTVEVYCKEFELSKTFEETVSGMWINSLLWDLKEGQTINVLVCQRIYNDHTSTWIERIVA